MKNFLDLLAINRDPIKIQLQVNPIFENGFPFVDIYINESIMFSGELTNQSYFEECVPINQSIQIKIILRDKQYSQEKETAVVVEKLKIDDIDIVPDFNYYIEYSNDHNQTVYSNYIGYNGVWKFRTQTTFYRWLHRASGKGWLID